MNTHHRRYPRRREALMALVGSALLPGCGGGQDVAGLSSGGTGSYTTGVVHGLGSIIVNGIRYDDSAAAVTFDGSASVIQLGMVVRVQGSAITPAATPDSPSTAVASRIVCSSEWQGPITGVDTVAGTLLVLGQTVRVAANAVFTGGQMGDALNSQYAEIYGFVNPSDGSLDASRVEVSPDRPSRYRLSGLVSNLDASTFNLGSVLIKHSSTDEKPATLQNGLMVRVDLETIRSGTAWVATRIRSNDLSHELQDDDDAEIEGTVTALSSPTAFQVNGISVDASQVTVPAGLVLGARVQVKGSVRGGVVVASKLSIESEEEVDTQEYEFHSTISALDTTAQTFVIRGYTLHYDGTTRFSLHGKTWANGLKVEAKARLDTSGQLIATKIEADD